MVIIRNKGLKKKVVRFFGWMRHQHSLICYFFSRFLFACVLVWCSSMATNPALIILRIALVRTLDMVAYNSVSCRPANDAVLNLLLSRGGRCSESCYDSVVLNNVETT